MRNYRTILLVEGLTGPDGRRWDVGSIELPDDGVELPIVSPRCSPDLPAPTVGWMRRFARIAFESHTAIVADIELWADAAGRRLSPATRTMQALHATTYELSGATLLPEDTVPFGWLHQRPLEAVA